MPGATVKRFRPRRREKQAPDPPLHAMIPCFHRRHGASQARACGNEFFVWTLPSEANGTVTIFTRMSLPPSFGLGACSSSAVRIARLLSALSSALSSESPVLIQQFWNLPPLHAPHSRSRPGHLASLTTQGFPAHASPSDALPPQGLGTTVAEGWHIVLSEMWLGYST